MPLEDVNAWPNRTPAGNQTFLESRAVIKIERKGKPISQGSSSFKFHPSGARQEGQVGHVYLGRPSGVRVNVQTMELDSPQPPR